MKKSLFLLLISTFLGVNLYAQENENVHEFRAYISDGYTLTITSLIASMFVPNDEAEISTTPHISVSYRYHMTPRFLIGGDVGFQSITWKPDRGSTKFTTIMPLAEFYYLNKPKVKLYGNAMVGLGIGSFKDSEGEITSGAFPSFQLNPIGVRVGRNYAGFAEIGAGAKGIFSAGFSAKF